MISYGLMKPVEGPRVLIRTLPLSFETCYRNKDKLLIEFHRYAPDC
jgi:hypothetical protein